MLFFVLLILNIPLFIKIKDAMYNNSNEFKKDVKYAVTPDIVSLFKGRYFLDRIAEFKLGLIISVYLGLVGIEYVRLSAIF